MSRLDKSLNRFFEVNPIDEFLRCKLSVDKINSEILKLDKVSEKISQDGYFESQLKKRTNLVLTVFDGIVTRLKEYCSMAVAEDESAVTLLKKPIKKHSIKI